MKQVGIGRLHASLLLARHGMSGQEALADGVTEDFRGAGDYLLFGAADIGKERVLREPGAQLFQQSDDGGDGCGEHDKVTSMNRVGRVAMTLVNGTLRECTLEHRRGVATDDGPWKVIFPKGEAERAADEAVANDGDLSNGHAKLRITYRRDQVSGFICHIVD